MSFLQKLFRKSSEVPSRITAKKRLQLVLVQDRMAIDSDTLEGLKNDLIDVIDKHLHIDKEAMEVSFNREGDSVAIIANIPVLPGSKPTE